MRRFVLAGGLVAAAVLAGCSSSSSSTSTSTTAAPTATTAAPGTTRVAAAAGFCGAVQQDLAVLRSDFVTNPGQASAFLAALRRVQAAAPSDLQEPIGKMVSAVEKLVASDATATTGTTGPGAAPLSNDALDALFAEDTAAAAKTFETRVKSECGIDLSSSGSSGSGSSGSTGSTEPLDGSSTTTSEGASATPTLDDLKAALKATAGSEAWYPALNGWGIGRVNDQADITLNADSTDTPLGAAGAVAACEAAASWANGKYAGATITVSGPDQKVLASKPAGAATCQPG